MLFTGCLPPPNVTLSLLIMASTEITVQAAQDKVAQLADKDATTTDSDIRYMAYGARLRTALRASTRYVAYVRDPLASTADQSVYNEFI